MELIIPSDLIMEIFSRLPSKSIARSRSLSKLWASMLGSPYFNELFMTTSSAPPRLLFSVQLFSDREWLFYSAPQPQNLYENSLVVAAELHTKFPRHLYRLGYCSYASGLINFNDMFLKNETRPMICNPITGQYEIFPEYRNDIKQRLLGFDPINKQFKVLVMDTNTVYNERVHHIQTLGTDKVKWRKIHCSLIHTPLRTGICINGVLYYFAEHYDKIFDSTSSLIVCFDVRYEKFKFIEVQCIPYRYETKMINYKGKLGGINLTYHSNNTLELDLLVLEDVDKQEWSKHLYTLPEIVTSSLTLSGVTATGEIVLYNWYIEKQFYVFFFNPERNTLRHIEIQGFGARIKDPIPHEVSTFVDHVEDLSFNDAKQRLFNSSIYAPPPTVKNKACSLNTIKERSEQHRRDRDRRYDNGKLREKKQRESRNERYNRRRDSKEMKDRERHVERKRDRDDRWSDKEYKRKRREKDYETRDR